MTGGGPGARDPGGLRQVGPEERTPGSSRAVAASPVAAGPDPDPLEVLTPAEASILLGISEDAVLARQREGLISAAPTVAELELDAALDENAGSAGANVQLQDRDADLREDEWLGLTSSSSDPAHVDRRQ